jgi:manganese/iron transport system permease protein
MLAVSVIVAAAASFAGVYLSFFLDSAPAPTIVLLLSGGFAIAFLVSRLRAARAERIARPA